MTEAVELPYDEFKKHSWKVIRTCHEEHIVVVTAPTYPTEVEVDTDTFTHYLRDLD